MKKYYLMTFVLLMFISCKNIKECDLVNLKTVRENELKLNTAAEKNLNDLTHIMEGSVYETHQSGPDVANFIVNELYFSLKAEKKVFWVVTSSYKDRTRFELMFQTVEEINLKDMTPDNIFYDNESLAYQSIGTVRIISKNNNPQGVKLKGVNFTKDNSELTYCEYRSQISFYMAPNRTIEFVEKFKSFLKQID